MATETFLGFEAPPSAVNVRHACGHELRWHFFKADNGPLLLAAGLAAALLCPLCDGTVPTGEADVSFAPTGICHAHRGPCPDSPHAAWLDSLGVRYVPGRLIQLGQ